MIAKFLVLHGPNLNLLGTREPAVYGTATQEKILEVVRDAARAERYEVDLVQSNHEGALIDAIHAAPDEYAGIILNPSSYTHTSIAIRDAVAAITIPVVEVHLSNVHRREPFRTVSYVAAAATATISGAGIDSYLAALSLLVRRCGAESKP